MKSTIRCIVLILSSILIAFFIIIIEKIEKAHYNLTDVTISEIKEKQLENILGVRKLFFTSQSDLYMDFYIEPINLKLERIEVLIGNRIIDTIEVNKEIINLEDDGLGFVDEETKKMVYSRKIFHLRKEFLRILGKNNEKFNTKALSLDIYIKNLKTRKSIILNRKVLVSYEETRVGSLIIFP